MRVLYHLPLSPFARKVRLLLSERRLPFELKVERVWERRPEFLAMNAAGTVPVLVEDNGLVIPDSGVICEYLEQAYPDTPMLGRTLGEGVEIRRLVAWFDGKFAAEVTRNLLGEKQMKRLFGRGNPDVQLIRAGYTNLRSPRADFAAAGHLSALDFTGEVDWSISPPARDWYSRMKSRPSFRPLLADRVAGVDPPVHYADLDF